MPEDFYLFIFKYKYDSLEKSVKCLHFVTLAFHILKTLEHLTVEIPEETQNSMDTYIDCPVYFSQLESVAGVKDVWNSLP